MTWAGTTGEWSQRFRKWREHGEMELLAAVIDQARLDIEAGLKKKAKSRDINFKRRLYFRRAWAWLIQPPDEPIDPWSFVWCCQLLEVCPFELGGQIILNYKNARRRQRRMARCRKRS